MKLEYIFLTKTNFKLTFFSYLQKHKAVFRSKTSFATFNLHSPDRSNNTFIFYHGPNFKNFKSFLDFLCCAWCCYLSFNWFVLFFFITISFRNIQQIVSFFLIFSTVCLRFSTQKWPIRLKNVLFYLFVLVLS